MRDMGSSMCSRRKGFLQSAFLLLTVAAFVYGAIMYSELHGKTRRAESLAQKYQQQQESLAAQLQVVYEHRSRLEKSLQRERGDHKKTKEDFLLYKLEVQENLSKDKQESLNRYNSLNAQHQILKSQHEELKQQYTDIHEQHTVLQETHERALQRHQEELGQLQQDKDTEISSLHQNMYKLREEGKQLRKAHQDVHNHLQETQQNHNNLLEQHEQLKDTLQQHQSQLAKAQVEVREYQQLKETLNKMPSLMQGAQGVQAADSGRKAVAAEAVQRDRRQPDDESHLDEKTKQMLEVERKERQTPISKVKSHYETQLEQQRMAKEREEAARRLAEQQELIYRQRLAQQEARQAALRQQEAVQQRDESLRQARIRQQAMFDQGVHGKDGAEEEEPEKNESEKNPEAADEHKPQDSVAEEQEAARANLAPLKPELQQHQPLIPAPSAARVENQNEHHDEHVEQPHQQQQHQQQHQQQPHQQQPHQQQQPQQEEEEEEQEDEEDQNPANDPNNQGEDEFEAEQALQERAQRVAVGAAAMGARGGAAVDTHDAAERFVDGANGGGEGRHAGVAPGGGGRNGRDEFEDAERALQQRVRSDVGRHGAGAVILGPEAAAGAGDADGIQPDEDDQLVVAGKPDQQEENEQEYQEEQDGGRRRVEGPGDDTGRDVGPDDAVEVEEHYDHGNEEEDEDGDKQGHVGPAAAAGAANAARHARRGADGGGGGGGGGDEEEEVEEEVYEDEDDRAARHPGGGRRGAEM
ncbi:Golgi integral membrane protein 4-like isoform X4 [Lethenteron reissneri]|uniref:Golgi integral membrane protein 4-like isoform X4 n=1 Tax=Lethenteron reissneri TaxID=7753 RepID=UPI002AB79487|nr:Golgi integral membrane protein 4-like isoform X4 [Lethenteron reissneri]